MPKKKKRLPFLIPWFLFLYLGVLTSITLFAFLRPAILSSFVRKKIEQIHVELQKVPAS